MSAKIGRQVHFEKPPVVEVALSVQFEPLRKLDGARVGLYWAGIKTRFPTIEQQPRLDPVVERFDVTDYAPRFLRIEFGEAVPRFWFLTTNESELLQVQQDRFIHNWRKKNVEPYPHYENLRESFANELKAFSNFLAAEGIGEIVPNQCEVTYINHIEAEAAQGAHARVEDVLTVWSGLQNPELLPSQLESADVRLRYVISQEGRKLGRLHIELQPAFRQQDGRPIWVLILTARGTPLTRDLGGVVPFMDVGRDHMLEAFLAITTRRLQEQWELRK